MIKILIVEDEEPISNLIEMNLSAQGYRCDCAFDGLQAADLLENNEYDLALLDIMLPKINGYELMEYIRPLNIPVIFITAKSAVKDRVKGLNMGAEDYLVKPFEIVELLARVEVVLRRFKKGEQILICGDVEIEPLSRTVRKNGQALYLTLKEYELLVFFIRNKNMALFRETIFRNVWEGELESGTRTVDLHVQRLRKKLDWHDKIVSVYKVGYRLEG